MKVEYKIASINYTGTDKEGYDEEKQTVNHIFIGEENTEYDDEDIEYMTEINRPRLITISLCHKFKNGLFFVDDDNNLEGEVNFKELEQHFRKSKFERICKICTKKLRKLQAKKEKV